MTTHNTTMLSVGERLKIARERARYQASQMARDLGRHRNMVTGYESTNDVPLWVIRTYADRLPNDTTFEWLVAEVGESPRDLRVRGSESGCLYGGHPPNLFDFLPDFDEFGRWAS